MPSGVDPAAAWARSAISSAILEGFVPFAREISVVPPAAATARCAASTSAENEHRDHILKADADCRPRSARIRSPADAVRIEAHGVSATASAMSACFAVEMFLCARHGRRRGGQRDRPARAQFRALDQRRLRRPRSLSSTSAPSAGWPLAAPARRGRVEMHQSHRRRSRMTGAPSWPSPARIAAPLRQARSPVPAARWATSPASSPRRTERRSAPPRETRVFPQVSPRCSVDRLREF
jgi:hypothetical protein